MAAKTVIALGVSTDVYKNVLSEAKAGVVSNPSPGGPNPTDSADYCTLESVFYVSRRSWSYSSR